MIRNWRAKTAYEMGRTPNHIYLRPHRLLRPFIAHYTIWTTSLLESPCVQPLALIPDASGCVVLHVNETKMEAKLWGATTKMVTVHAGVISAPVKIFIEFFPGGLFQFTGIRQSELTDRIFTLNDIIPGLFASICHLVETATCTEQIVSGLDRILVPILLARQIPQTACSMIRLLAKTGGLLTVEELAAYESYSPRHLNRVSSEHIGMSPKQFARILRINAAVQLLASDLPLTHLAQETGFYDQAHFIRDFSQICAVTPGDYRNHMSDFYNESLKF